MAHLLEMINGKASMFYYGEKPWHGLGTSVESAQSAWDAMKLAKLDFEVSKLPAFCEFNGKRVNIDGKFATIRTDTAKALGCVGTDYTIIQNENLFGFFDPIIDRDEAIYETAGVIDSGKKVWLLAKLPAHIRVKDDVIHQYVLLHASHDGTSSVIAKYTSIRVVCNNTLEASLNSVGDEVRVRHTVNYQEKIVEAHKIMGMVNVLNAELSTIFNKMALVKMDSTSLMSYINDTFPGDINPKTNDIAGITRKTREKVLELVDSGIGMDSDATRRTLYGAYNAVAEYASHTKFMESNIQPNQRAKSIWFGSSKALTQLAFDNAMKRLN
jgi:phage/plasmid-like protein (TIGR03299 family)